MNLYLKIKTIWRNTYLKTTKLLLFFAHGQDIVLIPWEHFLCVYNYYTTSSGKI